MMYSKWVSTSLPIRQQIAEQFGIAKIGTTHVVDNKVVADGYDVHDVESALSVSAIQSYLGVKEDNHDVLLDLLITRFEKGVVPIPEAPTQEVPDPEEAADEADEIVEETAPKKRGRKPAATVED